MKIALFVLTFVLFVVAVINGIGTFTAAKVALSSADLPEYMRSFVNARLIVSGLFTVLSLGSVVASFLSALQTKTYR